MQVIPILDLKEGYCVHSDTSEHHQQALIIKENPFDVAHRWIDHGATCLHLTDIDAFRSSEPEQVQLVKELKQAFPKIHFLIAGGIKNEEHVSIWLDTGVDNVVVGSRCFQDSDYLEGMCTEFPNKIMLSTEFKDGQWLHSKLAEHYGYTLPEIAPILESEGLAGLICANKISHQGINQFQFIEDLNETISMPLLINGGLYSSDDVKALKKLKSKSVNGIIVGRVIYQHILSFRKLVDSVK